MTTKKLLKMNLENPCFTDANKKVFSQHDSLRFAKPSPFK